MVFVSVADSISESIARATQDAREQFLGRMRGTYLVERENGTTEGDLPGSVVPNWETVWEGPGYTRYPGLAFEQTPTVGSFQFTVSRVVVRVPFGPVFRPGDRVTVVSDPDNPQIEGTLLRVASIDDQSQATAQRLLCEDFQKDAKVGGSGGED